MAEQHELWAFFAANGVPVRWIPDAMKWAKMVMRQTGATREEVAHIVQTVGKTQTGPWNPARLLNRRGTVERYLNPMRRTQKAGTNVGAILNELARRG